jgi:BlaI family penicillinase repressor
MTLRKRRPLSALENQVMDVVWQRGRATADEVRTALAGERELQDSTVRTVLRRLEEKGQLKHTVAGRTYVYEPRVDAVRAAAEAVRGIIERFCQGSVETLLVGMVDDEIVPAETLQALADKIAAAEAAGPGEGGAKPPAAPKATKRSSTRRSR